MRRTWWVPAALVAAACCLPVFAAGPADPIGAWAEPFSGLRRLLGPGGVLVFSLLAMILEAVVYHSALDLTAAKATITSLFTNFVAIGLYFALSRIFPPSTPQNALIIGGCCLVMEPLVATLLNPAPSVRGRVFTVSAVINLVTFAAGALLFGTALYKL